MRGRVQSVWLGALALLLAVGCANTRFNGAVRRQHAALYACASSAIRVTRTDPRTYVASGCGHRAVYTCRRGAVCTQASQAADPPRRAEATAERRHAQVAQQEEQRASAVRAGARGPELGGTLAEAEAICTSQGATFSPMVAPDGGFGLSCRAGGRLVFGAHVPEGQSVIAAVDVYHEGAQLTRIREAFVARYGAPVEAVNADGFRTFTWTVDGARYVVEMYARGVHVQLARGSAETARVGE